MSKHNETGLNGERLAEKFLSHKGYIILHRNWRSGKKEVDLIATKGDILVFVEVKTRSRTDFGYPEEAVDSRKISYLRTAAEHYMDESPEHQKIQFDIVSVQMKWNEPPAIIHFEDAFY